MAFDAFLKLDGILGESTNDKHRDEIDVLGLSWDIRAGTSGAPRFSELVVVKSLDRASPLLFQTVCLNRAIPYGRLTLVQNLGGMLVERVVLDFTGASVTRLAPAGDGNSAYTRPVEQLGLRFQQVTLTVRDDSGTRIQSSC